MSRHAVRTQGWDSFAEVVDDEWLERTPLRAEVRAALEVETRLMGRIAPHLPLSVPIPAVLPAGHGLPWRVRHRLVPGEPVEPSALTARDGTRVGELLRALHDLPFATWAGTGVTEDVDLGSRLSRMAVAVVPRLPEDLEVAGRALLRRCGAPTPLTLVHGDLGPLHLLHTGYPVTGVIDWTDAGLGDPAIDLAWPLHGTPAVFADAVAAAYEPSDQEQARAADWHRLGPWHEVLHGLDLLEEGDPRGHTYVEAGVGGAGDRLRW